MSVLFPMAAWLGLLAIPIVAFYLLKTRQRRRRVSTLLFWEELRPKAENSPLWRKLRRWVSLALQLLLFALILLAIMRVAFDWEQAAPRRVVALLDPSASMQAGKGGATEWVAACERLRKEIGRLRVQDEMVILTLETSPRIVQGWTSSRKALLEAVASVTPLAHGTDPKAALALASELSRLQEGAEVILFTDTVWPDGTAEALAGDVAIRVAGTGGKSNIGLTHFAVRRLPIAPGDWQLDAELVTTHRFEGTLELRRDGVSMDLVPVTMVPGEPWLKTWRGSHEGEAVFTASLRHDDALFIDNTAEARLAPLTPLRVWVFGPENPWLDAVLTAIPLVRWERVAALPESLPAEVDLIIAQNTTVPALTPGGPALLLINPPESGFWGEKTGALTKVVLSEIEGSERLLRHTAFSQVDILEAGAWKPVAGSRLLASAPEGPLVFAQWDRTPRWLVIGFDPERSDLMWRTTFPVLMGNLLQSLRVDDSLEATASLPGGGESRLKASIASDDARVDIGGEGGIGGAWVRPAWWWALFAACGLLLLEWGTFHRRITD